MRKTGFFRKARLPLLICILCAATEVRPDSFESAQFRHIAGGGLGDGGQALAASLLPRDIAVGSDGAILVADEQSNRVRAIAADGTITTLIGSGRYGGDAGSIAALDASLAIPTSLAAAPSGEPLYIVDLGNRQVRRLSAGLLEPFVTPENPIFDAVPGSFAPAGIAVGPEGKIHIADRGTNIVWQFDPDGGGRRAAGNGTRGYAGDGGPSALGQIANPVAVDVGGDGTIYIADRGNRRVRKVEGGQLSTIAGNGGTAGSWEQEAPALNVSIDPVGVAIAESGDLYILDALGNRLLSLSESRLHVVSSFSDDSRPLGISTLPDGRVLVADHGGRKVAVHDPLSAAAAPAPSVAGNGLIRASGDGDMALNASLYQPFGLAVDSDGNLYFADRLNHLVRRITKNGTIETVAGAGAAGYGGDAGPPRSALLSHPSAVAIDGEGRIWIADEGNHRIRRITPLADVIETVAGSGIPEFSGDGGTATAAGLHSPTGITFDADGALIVADSGNRRIRRLEADGTINTIAGNGETFPTTGGLAIESALLRPVDVAWDESSGLLITDADGHRVYRLRNGLLRPVAGTDGGDGASADGTLGTLVALRTPLGASPDGAGGTFIADTGNGRVGHVDGAGIFRTIESASRQPARILLVDDVLVISDVNTNRISEQALIRIAAESEPVIVGSGEFAIETLAAIIGPSTGIAYDPVADRLYLSYPGGIDELAAGGERLLFAEIRSPIAALAPITGAYDRGLVVASPKPALFGTSLTVVERHWKGWLRYLQVERPIEEVHSIALSPTGDLFAYRNGHLMRLRGSTWPTAAALWAGPDSGLEAVPRSDNAAAVTGFLGEEPTQAGSRFLTAADVLRRVPLEQVASLPDEPALLATTAEGTLYIALIQSQQLLALKMSAGVIELATRLKDAPVDLAVVDEDLFVATAGGRIHRYDADSGEHSLFASGFEPAIIGISARRSGLLYVLEGDANGGRLLALRPASRLLDVWPNIVELGPQPIDVAVRRTVALRNDGALAIAIAADLPPGTRLLGPTEFELEPGELLEVGVEMVPRARGRAGGEVVWRDAVAGDVLARTALTVAGLAPRIDVSETLALPTTWVGGRSVEMLTLTNTGDWALVLSQLAVTGFEPEALSIALSATTVAPGKTAEIAIAFTPGERRSYEGAIAIHSNDPEQPMRTVALAGAGGGAVLSMPGSYEMGAATLGERTKFQWQLTNSGDLPVEISQVLSGDRRVSISPRQMTIGAGESGRFDIVFSPDEMRPYNGSFRFFTNDPLNPELQVPFSGRGVSTLIQLNAHAHEFETTSLGERRRWGLELTNLSRRRLNIVTVSSNSRQFRIVDKPRSLEPAESGSITIEYRPSNPGSVRATLTVETDLREVRIIEIPLSGRTATARRFTLTLQSANLPLQLWPGEEVRVSVDVEQAVKLKGLALELSGPFAGLDFAGVEYPPESLIGGVGQPLTVTGFSQTGKLQIGVSLTGLQGEQGISGDGQLAVLKFRVRNLRPESGRRLSIEKAVLRSALGFEETLTSATTLIAVDLDLSLKGDFDADGQLGLSDFFMIADALGAVTSPARARFDLTGNGRVDREDVELLRQHMAR